MFDDAVRFCPVDGARVQPAAGDDANLGQVLLGQFEVRDVCGRGAMGTVYRAYQRNMDRIVAVKVLRRELLKEPEVVRRFLREARASAKLQHPNIVTVHLVGETDEGVPFLVMEHVDGVSLEVICEAQGAQPVARTLSLGRQIASALGEAHDHGIVHRDLKPANILVTDRSRVPDLVKVLDFGIAKLVHAADQSVLTREGVIFGTPHYIAPEQATGGEIDHRADLYSLGVILFRLATGRLPFEGSQGMQVVLKHLRDAPPRPRALEPELPGALEELILACLAKDRAARPEDTEAVIAALDRVAARSHEPRPPLPASAQVRRAPSAPATPTATATASDATGKVKVVSSVATPSASGWGARPLFIGSLLAIAIGSGVGVVGAMLRDRVVSRPEIPAPVGIAPPQEPVEPIAPPAAPVEQTASEPPPVEDSPPAAPEPTLVEEHLLAEGGVTLRCGLERAAALGRSSALVATLSTAHGAVLGAVQAEVRAPDGKQERLIFHPAPDGPYRADYTFAAPGRYRLRVTATTPAEPTPLALAFDLAVAQPHHSAKVARRARHHSDDDLPVTVVPPDPAPAPAPVAIPPATESPPPIITAPAPPGDPNPQPLDPYSDGR
ncbi:MAG TPA: protein kinase [Polyangia bacterium]